VTTTAYTLDAEATAHACEPLLVACATELRHDVVLSLEQARMHERSETARRILDLFLENARIARDDGVPLCQDTGTVWVLVELDEGVNLIGDLATELDAVVARVWDEQGLRASMVRDALLDRTNTGNNTPVFVEVVQSKAGEQGNSSRPPAQGATLSVMLKGAGSDNASRVRMLDPCDDIDVIESKLVALVREKASMACPPLVIGIGIGSTFDKVASLSKRALLGDITVPHPDEHIAKLERRLLDAVNATGIGPGGLGGDTTALAVKVLTAPCHIAALPLAMNLGCSALRSRTIRIEADTGVHGG